MFRQRAFIAANFRTQVCRHVFIVDNTVAVIVHMACRGGYSDADFHGIGIFSGRQVAISGLVSLAGGKVMFNRDRLFALNLVVAGPDRASGYC